MATTSPYPTIALGLTLCGTMFAGYMSYEKFTQEMCAFDEPCPMFLGKPACYFGFAMFLFMFLVSLNAYLERRTATQTVLIASSMGTAFAGFYVVEEAFTHGIFGKLGLSVCTWGLTMFAAVLFVTYKQHRLEKNKE